MVSTLYIHVAKVADFGLSKTKESSSSYSSLTVNTGTRRWMAPELLRPGEDDLGARTSDQDSELRHPFKVDVYSFGMVCYEILTGQVPFSSVSSLFEVKKMVLKGERPELPERCPELVKRLICSCWETDPTRRPCFEEICRNLRHLKWLMMLGTDSIIGSKQGYYVELGTLKVRMHFGYERFPEWKYKITEIELPQGGQSFSKVFVAFDVMSGVTVAVNRMEKNEIVKDPHGVKDVKQEVYIMRRRLGKARENIVEFYEAYEDDDHVYIVME